MSILVINAGSSSLKFALFAPDLTMVTSGAVTEIGGDTRLLFAGTTTTVAASAHDTAIAVALDALASAGHPTDTLTAAAHRVVHGGQYLTAPCRITPDIEAAIETCVPLAPLHNPANLAGIRAMHLAAPALPQFASFDTAFHATNPSIATTYAIPALEQAKGIRRYGFHGISYASLVSNLPQISGQPMPQRLLALHLGNGASLCAVRDGHSVATTMGYSPLDGLTMGTRTGEIDGNAVLRLAADHGIARAAEILNRESGLLALGGASDMRALGLAKTDAARFAIDHFTYWAIRHAGSMIAAMGGLDALAFTGGIGENDTNVRFKIMQGLAYMGLVPDSAANACGATQLHIEQSPVAAWIIPAAEERHIAAEALAAMS